MTDRLSRRVAALLSVGLFFLGSLAIAAPKSELQKFWLAHNDQSAIVVSHQAWQNLLDKYLDAEHPSGVNRFDYAGVGEPDRKALKAYLDSLQTIDPHTLSRDEQFAYWVNLYNALTAQVVLNEYPIESIRSVRFLTSPFGPWDKNLVKVNGKRLSLNDIEHGILRPIWRDPRIHFAVNCASIGCPNLVDKAYTAVNADSLLQTAAKSFINHARGVEIRGDTLLLSEIFDWYASDFGSSQSELVAYIAQFFDAGIAPLERASKLEYQYDWGLNKP